jgi:hypothetical protein
MNQEEPEVSLPVSGSLVRHTTSTGTAWRATEFDAPGLFALITTGADVPNAPETDTMTFAVYEEGVNMPLGAHVIVGRPGLNQFYLTNVGHEPDKEPDGARPILQFIDDVAAHLLLRYFVGEAIEDSDPGPV